MSRRKTGVGFCTSGGATPEFSPEAVSATRGKTKHPSRFGKDLVNTLECLVNPYLKHKFKTNTARTMETRERRVRMPLKALLQRRPTEVSAAELVSTLAEWCDSKSPSTARSGIQEVKSFWKWLRLKKYITRDQWAGIWEEDEMVELRKSYPTKKKVLPQHRVTSAQKLYGHLVPIATEEPRSVAMVALLELALGFRVGEVLRLKAQDIDAGGTIVWVECGKTEAGVRQVEVPAPLVPILTAAANGLGADERVFPYTNNQVYPRVKKLCKAAGVQELGNHALRRTNATLRVIGGQSPDVVIKAMGHTRFSMTRDHYIEPGTVENAGQTRVAKALKLG